MPKSLVGYVWNSEERRLRAPYRVFTHLFVFVLVQVVGLLALRTLIEPETTANWLRFVSSLIVGIPAYGITLYVGSRLLDRRPLRSYGLGVDSQWLREYGVGVATGAVLLTGAFLFLYVFGWVEVEQVFYNYSGAPFAPAFVAFWLLVLAVFVLQIANAAYTIKNVSEGLSGYTAVTTAVGVAVVFRLLLAVFLFSDNPDATSYSIFVQLLLQLIVLLSFAYTGNVAFGAGFAAAWTGFILLVFDGQAAGIKSPVSLFGVAYDGPPAVTGGEFGLDGGLVALFATVFALFFLFGWLRLKGRLGIPEVVYRRIDRLGD